MSTTLEGLRPQEPLAGVGVECDLWVWPPSLGACGRKGFSVGVWGDRDPWVWTPSFKACGRRDLSAGVGV